VGVSPYAVTRDGVTENVVSWDGDPETWQPPEGTQAEPYDPAVHQIAVPAERLNAEQMRDRLAQGVQANRAFIAAAKPATAAATANAAYDAAVRNARMVNIMALLLVAQDTTDTSGT
jgi:hypothetical protein